MADPSSPNLQDRTRSELLELKERLESEIASIRNQLGRAMDEARRTGRYADGGWWVKSHYALRIKGRQCQKIQNELSRLRQKAARDLETAFFTVAKRELPSELFREILKKAGTC